MTREIENIMVDKEKNRKDKHSNYKTMSLIYVKLYEQS